jgi:hypothetical protein
MSQYWSSILELRRFPCVDGVRFAFDPEQPPGNRVVPGSVFIRGKPLAPKRHTINRWGSILTPRDNGPEISLQETSTSVEDSSNALDGYHPLDMNRKYSLASTEYVLNGKVCNIRHLCSIFELSIHYSNVSLS